MIGKHEDITLPNMRVVFTYRLLRIPVRRFEIELGDITGAQFLYLSEFHQKQFGKGDILIILMRVENVQLAAKLSQAIHPFFKTRFEYVY